MKPQLENLLNNSMHSFRVKRTTLSYFDSPWHYHPDYELFYIIKSKGKRFVGDNIENFYQGDMVFMGPDLPHVWKNDEEYYKNPKRNAEAIVMQFKEDAFGEGFFNLPEMQSVRAFFKLSKRGLKISGDTHKKIARELKIITKLSGVERFTSLLNILNILANSSDLTPLTTESFEKIYYDTGSDKINQVFEYVTNEFRNDIQLIDVAKVANISKTAFCRYFKTRAVKTFFEYLTDVRINYAGKLLIEDQMSISEISYECGFNSPSYFNKQFKKLKTLTPKEYRDKYKPLIQK